MSTLHGMTRRWGVGVALALVAALTTGCPASEDDPPDEGSGLAAGDEYVALGDSYTAASLTGRFQQPVDGCGRSATNYPSRVAAELGLKLYDASCNGASTREVTAPQELGIGDPAPPQISEVDEDTDLVTIGLGGNDFRFLGRIIGCATQFAGEKGAPCARLDKEAGPESVAKRLPDVEKNLIRTIRAVRKVAPDARVLVVGYPQPFPDEGTCSLVPLPRRDYAWARSVVEGLNDALEGAARRQDVGYVDVEGPSEGHDICSEDPWVAGAKVVGSSASPWHPYPAEVEAVAGLVLDALREED